MRPLPRERPLQWRSAEGDAYPRGWPLQGEFWGSREASCCAWSALVPRAALEVCVNIVPDSRDRAPPPACTLDLCFGLPGTETLNFLTLGFSVLCLWVHTQGAHAWWVGSQWVGCAAVTSPAGPLRSCLVAGPDAGPWACLPAQGLRSASLCDEGGLGPPPRCPLNTVCVTTANPPPSAGLGAVIPTA